MKQITINKLALFASFSGVLIKHEQNEFISCSYKLFSNWKLLHSFWWICISASALANVEQSDTKLVNIGLR